MSAGYRTRGLPDGRLATRQSDRTIDDTTLLYFFAKEIIEKISRQTFTQSILCPPAR